MASSIDKQQAQLNKRLEQLDREQAKHTEATIARQQRLFENSLNKSMDLLENFYKAGTELGKDQIKGELESQQEKQEKMLNQMKSDLITYSHFMDKKSKKTLKSMIEDAEDALNDMNKVVDTRLGKFADNIDEAMEQVSDTILGRINNLAKEVRDMATAYNVDSIANDLGSNIQDQVDSYIENTRSLKARSNGQVNLDDFDATIDNGMIGSHMSRNEVSDLIKDAMEEAGLKNGDAMKPFAEDLVNLRKVFDISFKDMDNIIYSDMNGSQDGAFAKSMTSLVTNLATDQDLNVDANDLMGTLNEHVMDYLALSKNDYKVATGMAGSLASIEAVQESMHNEGVSSLGDKLKEASTMSYSELLDDEDFQNLLNNAGIDLSDYVDNRSDPEQMKDMTMTIAKSIADQVRDDQGGYNAKALSEEFGISSNGLRQISMAYDDGSLEDTYSKALKTTQGDGNQADLGKLGDLATSTTDMISNWFSNSTVGKGIGNFLGTFDVKLANLANLTIIGSTLLKGAGKLLGNLKDMEGFPKSLKDLKGFGSKIKGAFSGSGKFGKNLAKIDTAKTIAGKISSFFKGLKNTFSSFESLADIGKFFSKGFNKVKDALGGFSKVESLFKTKFASFSSVFSSAKGLFSKIGKFFGVFDDIGSIGKVAETLGKSSSTLGKSFEIVGKIGGAASKVLGIVGTLIDPILGFFKADEWFGEDSTMGQSLISAVAAFLAGTGGGIGSGESFLDLALDFFGGAAKGAAVGSVGGPAGTVVGAIIGGILSLIGGERIAKFIDSMTDCFANVNFSDMFGSIFDDIGSWLLDKVSGIPIIGDIVKGIAGSSSSDSDSNSTPSTPDTPTTDFNQTAQPVQSDGGVDIQNPQGQDLSSLLGIDSGNLGTGETPFEQALRGVFGITSGDTFGTMGLFGNILSNILVGGAIPQGGVLASIFGEGGDLLSNLQSSTQSSGSSSGSAKPAGGKGGAASSGPSSSSTLDAIGQSISDTVSQALGTGNTNTAASVSVTTDQSQQSSSTLSTPTSTNTSGDGNAFSGAVTATAVPQYEVGTPWLPNDQVALVHEGEMIVPSAVNPLNDPYTTSPQSGINNNEVDNSEVVDTLKWQVYQLEDKLDTLVNTILGTGSKNNGPSYSAVDKAYSV